ncbi:MAG: acyl-CoA dehydrogenase family protein [Tsuneonella sp.]
MDLQPSEQQDLLRQSLDGYLARNLPFAVRRDQDGAAMLAFWDQLRDDLAIAGAGLPEAVGGLGGDAQEEMIVAAALGRALAVTPYIDCFVLAAHLLIGLNRTDEARRIAPGELLAVVASDEPQTRGVVSATATHASPVDDGWRLDGRKLAVPFAAQADLLLIPARIGENYALFALDSARAQPALKHYRLIDDTPAADLLLEGFALPEVALLARGSAVLPALKAAVDRATAALCGEAAGLAETMVADTVAYAKERKQFGQALASFQALQHRMVDMFIASEEVSAAALLAALKPGDPAAVSAAKARIGECLRLIGQEAVQLHGAMGLTEELRVGHYFKRATVIENRLGNADRHVARYRKAKLPAG